MRLIDANKLLEDMRLQLEEAVEDETTSKDEALVIMTSAIALKEFVNQQPTAYDIDNVVEQLEEITIVTDYGDVVYCNLDSYGSMDCPTKDCHYCLINKAIEIVKGGAK